MSGQSLRTLLSDRATALSNMAYDLQIDRGLIASWVTQLFVLAIDKIGPTGSVPPVYDDTTDWAVNGEKDVLQIGAELLGVDTSDPKEYVPFRELWEAHVYPVERRDPRKLAKTFVRRARCELRLPSMLLMREDVVAGAFRTIGNMHRVLAGSMERRSDPQG